MILLLLVASVGLGGSAASEAASRRYLLTAYGQTLLHYLWLTPAELDAAIDLLTRIKTSARRYESIELSGEDLPDHLGLRRVVKWRAASLMG
jgi:hypothetical protein